MSVSFTCHFCARKYKVDEGLAGRRVKCKECGTDLTVPSAKAPKSPQTDLYGLDDAVTDAAPPPPRRPGFEPEPAASRRSRPAGSGGEGMHRAGVWLLSLGGLSFVLPFVGLQVKGLHLLPPAAQLTGGFLMVVVGAFLLMAASGGFLKAMAFTALGAIVGVPVLILVAALLLPALAGQNGNGNGNGNVGPQANQPVNLGPNAARPNFMVNPPAPNAANAPAADLGRVAITGGRVMTGRGPAGIGTMGVSFQIDYRVESQPPGVFQYDLIIKTPKGRTKVVPPVHLRDSGTHGVTVPMMTRNDGPFEVCFEAESFGPGGRSRRQVSDLVAMAWTEAPPEQNPFGPPGMNRNPGVGNRPGNFPGQPGYRPPGMPNIPMGPRMPMGPRGRR